jgi:hypothetical protein
VNTDAAYVCSHVFGNAQPVLLVSRAGDGWRCLCGDEHDPNEPLKIVAWTDLVRRDATLAELINLPNDWEAARLTTESRWIRARSQSHE